MTWFKIDDDFFFHPKVIAAGNSAIGLFVRCGSWASNHLTDGHIPDKVIEMFGCDADITRLVEVDLLEETDGGYFMSAFLDYNPSADEVKATRAASAERQRQSRTRRSDDSEDVTRDSRVSHNDVTRESHVTANEVTRESQRPDPTRPVTKTPPPPADVIHKVVVVAATKIIDSLPPPKAPKNPAGYRASVIRRLKAEHDVAALIAMHGVEAAAEHIVHAETGPPPPAAPPQPEHDPNCADCSGSGWRTIDQDRNLLDRCLCAPTIAPVLEMRRHA